MENMSNQLIGFLALIVGLIVGWFLRGVAQGKWDRRGLINPRDVKFLWNHDASKALDIEYKDKKFQIVENKLNSRL